MEYKIVSNARQTSSRGLMISDITLETCRKGYLFIKRVLLYIFTIHCLKVGEIE